MAAGLGSDVPFFLRGGTALAEGRGERVTPLPDVAADVAGAARAAAAAGRKDAADVRAR